MTRIVSKYWFDYANKAIDDIESTKDIIRKTISFIEKNHKIWIDQNDARANFLIGIKKVLQSTQLNYVNMRYCLIDIIFWEKFAKEFKREDIPEHIKEYNVLILSGWINGISTVIEESFRSVYKELFKDKKGTEPFYNIYKDILKELGLQNHKNVFDLFRLVRNGIHTNYVFYPPNQKNEKIEYKGIIYQFIVGRRMDFMNIEFINEITKGIVDVLTKIVKHNKISEMPKITRMITE